MTTEQTALEFDDVWIPLSDGSTFTSETGIDDLTAATIAPFDLSWDGSVAFTSAALPVQLPTDYGIGVIVGASGSGKSTLLRDLGRPTAVEWTGRAIASHFGSPEEAARQFYAVGLNAVPTWTKPYSVLSNGERFRADLARTLTTGAIIDEYTSVVDRDVALSTSNALRRHVTTNGLRNVVIATCHRDVLPWLQPDWVIDLDIRCWSLRPRECLQRPDFMVTVYAGSTAAWEIFGRHHYLDGAINRNAETVIASMNGRMVGMSASLSFPNGNLSNAWREHRTVVLPDFQGLGIGMHLADWVGQHMLDRGRRYFSRTAHPRMGAYRDASPLWRATSSSGKRARSLTSYMSEEYLQRQQRTGWDAWDFDTERVGWSHEYIGAIPITHPTHQRTVPLTLGLA